MAISAPPPAELNMTQSAVSYQIKLLENYVGAPLFVRQARGVALSEKGDTIAPTDAAGPLAISPKAFDWCAMKAMPCW